MFVIYLFTFLLLLLLLLYSLPFVLLSSLLYLFVVINQYFNTLFVLPFIKFREKDELYECV